MSDEPNVPRVNAVANPAIVASPILLPPSTNASGIIDSANIASMAPAAKDVVIPIVVGLVFDRTLYPSPAESVPINTAKTIGLVCIFYFFPFDLIPWDEAEPSGKFEMIIAIIKTKFTVPPKTKEIPRAIFSGILSITDLLIKLNPVPYCYYYPGHLYNEIFFYF